jgi:phosphoglycerate dehydrogenase-like enzyme
MPHNHVPTCHSIAIEDTLLARAPKGWPSSTHLRVLHFPRGDAEAALKLVEDYSCRVFIIGTHRYPDDFFCSLAAPSLIQRMGTGCSNIPLELCQRLGHTVAVTSGAVEDSVAEHALMLMLACARHAREADLAIRNQTWTRLSGLSLYGKTLGLAGYGAIARKFASIAKKAFNMRIHALVRRPLPPDGLIDEYTTDPKSLFSRSQFISLHLPETTETCGLVNRELLAALQPGGILVNTARGSLINEDALAEALLSGHLAAAGLDVFKNEPYVPSGRHDLRKINNLLMTPHIASSSDSSNALMLQICLDNSKAFLETGFCPDKHTSSSLF